MLKVIVLKAKKAIYSQKGSEDSNSEGEKRFFSSFRKRQRKGLGREPRPTGHGGVERRPNSPRCGGDGEK